MNQVTLRCPSCKHSAVEKYLTRELFSCSECQREFSPGSLEYEQLNNKYKKYQPEEPKQELPTRCPNCNKSLVEESYHHSDGTRSRQYVCDDCKTSIPDFKSGYQVCPICNNKKCYYIKDKNEFHCWNCNSIFKQDDPQFAQLHFWHSKLTPSHTFTPRANSIQHGGTHYKTKAIQPWDYVIANNLGFLEGNAIKYITRHKDKNGIDDIKKAIHYLQKLLEVLENEQRNGSVSNRQDQETS